MTQKIKIKFYGAAGEVGRSAILIKTDRNILLDFGAKQINSDNKIEYPIMPEENVDAVILSHAHFDHSGAIPMLFSNGRKIPVYMTQGTKVQTEIILYDSICNIGNSEMTPEMLNSALEHFKVVSFGHVFRIGDTEITLYRAGHIPGSAFIDIRYKGERLIYTGDFNLSDTRLLHGADITPLTTGPKIDYLISESTYARRDHPDREQTEHEFIEAIKKGLERGRVLIPSFAIQRTAEVLRVIFEHLNFNSNNHNYNHHKKNHKNRTKVYVHGMGLTITQKYLKLDEVKRIDKLKYILKKIVEVHTSSTANRALREHSIIISTAGMMNGGPVLKYAVELNSKDTIILPGYCVEGTNGRKLMDEHIITLDGFDIPMPVKVLHFSFSAHADRSDLLRLYNAVAPRKIFIVHGDYTQEFTGELINMGFDAVAPKLGDEF